MQYTCLLYTSKTVEMHIHRILKEFFSAHYLMNKLKIMGKC